VFALCLPCLVMAGFNVQALSFAGPAIVAEWGVPGSALGLVFGAGNLGILVGALVFSTLADRIGRKPVLVGVTLFFSAMTIATAFAASVPQLLWLRLLAGIGLGSVIPNATALIGEFSPARSRVTLMMCITVGFTAGAAGAGFIAAALMPAYGWPSVFLFGGVVPLVVAVAMRRGLPESLQFLAVRRRDLDTLRGWVRQLDPALPVDAATEFIVHEESRGGVPIVHLLRDGRALPTVLLWILNFTNLLNLYALGNWLPTVVARMGYPTQTAVLVGAILQVGGTVGAFGLAWLISKKGFMPILTATFAIATVSIAGIGYPGMSLPLLCVVVFVAGWCVVGGQPGINALAATFYPTYLRSTGVGWGLGVGRLGAIVGPVIGGEMMARQFTTPQLFLSAAVPALVSTVVMFGLRYAIGRGRGASPPPLVRELN
jgi:AAHS family 4-hydroxybenzoate transporter-like MFS transporter